MPRREFATQKKLQDYAERIGDTYLWEGTPAFAKRQQLLSPDQIRDCGGAHVPWRTAGVIEQLERELSINVLGEHRHIGVF